MTEQQASKILSCFANGVDFRENHMGIPDEYQELAELMDEAIRKQIVKKIEIWNGQCACPNCNKLFGSLSQLKTLIYWEMPHCKFCGQALDWEVGK